jgi:hypothetical protein
MHDKVLRIVILKVQNSRQQPSCPPLRQYETRSCLRPEVIRTGVICRIVMTNHTSRSMVLYCYLPVCFVSRNSL